MISISLLRKMRGVMIFAMLCFLLWNTPGSGEQAGGFHVRSGVKFPDSPLNMQFITAFPMEQLLQDTRVTKDGGKNLMPGYITLNFRENNKNLQFSMSYWIFISPYDLEEKFLEQITRYQIGFDNAIDIGKSGEIGDNCWYYMGEYIFEVWFMRNNVLINIRSSPDQTIFLDFVKYIDNLLIEKNKVASANEIPAVIITSAEIITENQQEGLVTIKIYATDPRGLPLNFKFLGEAVTSSGSSNGIITMPASGNRNIFWVMNEDRIVYVLRKDFFSRTP